VKKTKYVKAFLNGNAAYLLLPLTMYMFEEVWVSQALTFIIGLAVTLVVTYLVNSTLMKYFQRLAEKQPNLLTMYVFLRRLVIGTLVFLGVSVSTFISFPNVGIALTSLLITAGFASLVLGLAAQSSLSNIISGILVSTAQPFRIGDAIFFRNDFCFVEDIKLMHTVLRTWDNRRIVVPNSIFQTEAIINYSIGDPSMLVPIIIQVSYESDLRKAMDIMVEVARKHPDFLPAPGLPQAVVMDYADSGITLRLLTRAKDQPTAFMMARDLLLHIKEEFDANGIEIPYPRRYLVLDKRVQEQLSKLMEVLQPSKNTPAGQEES